MKKIKILTTGGTLFQEEKNNIRQIKTDKESMIEKTRKILESYANIDDIESLYNIDSSDLTPQNRELLANNILENESKYPDKYDGYIITHGTDTMSYSASMLSFLLKGIRKPIVLTGSMIGLDEDDSDGPNNLINSIQGATNSELKGVFICFGDKLIQGNKAKKEDTAALDTFDSPKYDLIGMFNKEGQNKELSINKNQLDNLNSIINNQKIELFDNLNSKVELIKLRPGMDLSIFDYLIKQNIEGLILEGYGDGNVPKNKKFQEKIKMCIDAGIIIVLKSQCHTGPAEHKYEGAQELLGLGAISGMNMTSEVAYTKLMWLLSNKNKYDIENIFKTNVAGELL